MDGGLAENIALLHFLNPEPGRVGENTVPDSIERDPQQQNRVLSLKHERAIAEDLVFLAAYTDDALKVIALCIEEKAGGDGMIVRTAINSGIQESLRRGLQSIATALEGLARQGARAEFYAIASSEELMCSQDPQSAERDDDLIKAVVHFNRLRLLNRLRSQHAQSSRKVTRNGALKPQPIPRLVQCLQLVQNRAGTSVTEWEEFDSLVTALNASFMDLESLTTEGARSVASDKILRAILETADKVASSRQLRRLLSKLPANLNSWDPKAKEALTHRLKKLGRYHQACRYLLQAARRFPIFRSISIEPVSGKSLTCDAIGLSGSTRLVSRQGLLHRTIQNGSNRLSRAELRQVQARFSKDPWRLQSDLEQEIQKERRVHAEVQLLFYYEVHPESLIRPRVICSNKSTCYLCNLFIHVHGRFYSPRTHGKLYCQWAIPSITGLNVSGRRKKELQSMIDQFNELIEQKIRSCLLEKRHFRNHPDESFISKASVNFTPSVVSKTSKLTKSPVGSFCAEEDVSRSGDSGGASDSLETSSSITEQPTLEQAAPQGATRESSNDSNSVLLDSTHIPNREPSIVHSENAQRSLEASITLLSPSDPLERTSDYLGNVASEELKDEQDNTSEEEPIPTLISTCNIQNQASQYTDESAKDIVDGILLPQEGISAAEQPQQSMPLSSSSHASQLDPLSRASCLPSPQTQVPSFPSPTLTTASSNSLPSLMPSRKEIRLTPNATVWHHFPYPSSSPLTDSPLSLRLLTTHIHITLEHYHASLIASRSTSTLDSRSSTPEGHQEMQGFWIKAEWLAHVNDEERLRGCQIFDLAGDWTENEVSEGALVDGGILLCKNGDYVYLWGDVGSASRH